MPTPVEKHFDIIAKDYDYFKKRNWFYYKNLKKLYKELIPAGKVVLEIGCGTGDLITELNCKKGVGLDISAQMVEIAKQKHPNLEFIATTVENYKTATEFDFIFLADVIEHLENIPSTVEALSKLCTTNTSLIFTYANPLWEPILMLLEKLKMKMPEGPHYRIPFFKFKKILKKYGLTTVRREWRLLVPANIPLLSGLLNSVFYRIPLLRRLGMLEFLVIKKI